MRNLLIAFLFTAFAFASGCVKQPATFFVGKDINAHVLSLSENSSDLLPSLSIAGRAKIHTGKNSGSVEFVLLFDHNHGLRLDAVDPFYRPLVSSVVKNDRIWIYDPGTGKTTEGGYDRFIQNITGLPVPTSAFMPLILGKVPKEAAAVEIDNKCEAHDGYSCFTLRDKSGNLHSKIVLDNQSGLPVKIGIPAPYKEKVAIIAEFSGSHHSGIPRKVKISHLESGDFVVLRYSDIQAGDVLDPSRFDPKLLGHKP